LLSWSTRRVAANELSSASLFRLLTFFLPVFYFVTSICGSHLLMCSSVPQLLFSCMHRRMIFAGKSSIKQWLKLIEVNIIWTVGEFKLFYRTRKEKNNSLFYHFTWPRYHIRTNNSNISTVDMLYSVRETE